MVVSDLYIERHIRIIKYFIKLHIQKSDNCILYTLIHEQRKDIETNPLIVNWSSKVRNILQNCGFVDVRLYPESVNINCFTPLLRNRLRDIYI